MLIGIPNGAKSLDEVLTVSKGDKSVVLDMAMEPSKDKSRQNQRANEQGPMLFLHAAKLAKFATI